MLIPKLAARPLARSRVVDLHKAHAALNQPPRHQALLAKCLCHRLIQAIHFLGFRGLTADIKCFWRFLLHPKC